MHEVLKDISDALDQTAKRVIGSIGYTNTLREAINWQFPILTRDDLAGIASQLAKRIREADIDELEELDESRLEALRDVPRRLQLLWAETFSQINNGQPAALSAYLESMDALEKALNPILSMTIVDDPRLLPARTATRLKSVNRTMDRVEQDHAALLTRVSEINQAHAAAERLPTTLQELEEARIALDEIRAKVERIHEETTKTQGKIETTAHGAESEAVLIRGHAVEAEKLIKQCEDAYHITTTKGLAGAFDQRAQRLNISIVLWVIGLLIALYFGAEIGSKRIEALTGMLAVDKELRWGTVILNVILSVLSVGGPLWFAWLATKQIGQRFRLAEDYAYKASVAKAYEGYRKQAAHLDEAFSARLFSTALTRLEEAPLRLVEQDAHGSPWHEIMRSEAVKKAVATIPEFQDKVLELAKKSLDTAAAAVSSRAPAKEVPASGASKDGE